MAAGGRVRGRHRRGFCRVLRRDRRGDDEGDHPDEYHRQHRQHGDRRAPGEKDHHEHDDEHRPGEEAEHRLYQLAYPGTTIRRIAQHILPELTARRADTVLISAGINDLLLDGTSPRELVELVQRLCADLEAEGMRPVVLGPTWLDAQRVRTVLGHEVDPDLVREHRERLAAWARQTHRDHLDPWPVLEGHPERVRADGLHPDAEGHRMLARWLLGLAQGPAEDWQPA